MKITLIAAGIMFIPQRGWAPVETVVWEYNQALSRLGHNVQMINTRDTNEILREINRFEPDVINLHCDEFANFLSEIKHPKKIATSHYPYIEQKEKHGAWAETFNCFINGNFYIFCLSEGIKNAFKSSGVSENRLKVLRNGAKNDLIKFDQNAKMGDRSIFLAKISDRKRQHLFQKIPNLYFAGNRGSQNFDYTKENYLGPWSREDVYENLTHYGNLVLLSDSEADPLVVKEGLMAGLGVVVSEYAVANLDLTMPFIDVVPESKINDLDHVQKVIETNRNKSLTMRREIRRYALDTFSWDSVAKDFINLVNTL